MHFFNFLVSEKHKVIVGFKKKLKQKIDSTMLSNRLERMKEYCNFPEVKRGLGYLHQLSNRNESQMSWEKIITSDSHRQSSIFWCASRQVDYSHCTLDTQASSKSYFFSF